MIQSKPFIYNPAQKTKEQLIAEFVVRKNTFEKIFNELKNSPRDLPPQHYLIAGQRGMGKTTLLLRLMFAIEDDQEMKGYLIPIRFSEEQYNIVRLEHLWEETATLLEFKCPIYEGLNDEMVNHENDENYERICFDLLEIKLKQHNHRLLLLIDNIGDLFDKFPPLHDNRLREVLMTSSCLQLIGSSSKVLEHTFHYDKPFFEFFNQIKLEPLDQPSTLELLNALGKELRKQEVIDDIISNSPERIDVLRQITGGVPRTVTLLFDIFINDQNGDAFEDLHHLLDEVNSQYKHRMDELKPQQQQIIDALARAWDPITASDILKKSKLYRENVKSNQISAQLKQLAENQVVEILDNKGRTRMYRIRERFFNIWYLMRHGRQQNKEKVLWLIKCIEAWCSLKDIKILTDKQIEFMQLDQYSEEAAFYKAIAIHGLKDLDRQSKLELLIKTKEYLINKGNRERAEIIEKIINDDNLKVRGIRQELEELRNQKEFAKIELVLLNAIKQNMQEFIYPLAINYEYNLMDYTKAEQYYLRASELGDKEADNALGAFYIKKGLFVKAEAYFIKASEQGQVDANFNLALLYQNNNKDYNKAEEFYLKATDKGHMNAMNNLAAFYKEVKKDYKKSEVYYLKAIKKGHIDAIFNLALLYYENIENYDKAERYYLQAIEKGHPEAMNNLAILYQLGYKDYDKAEEFYLKAAEKGHEKAIYNLGLFYYEIIKNYDKAEEYFLKTAKNGNSDAMFNLAIIYTFIKKNDAKAEDYYKKTIASDNTYYKAINNLCILLLEQNRVQEMLEWLERLFQNEDFYSDMKIVLYRLKDLFIIKQYHFLLKMYKKENSLLMKHAYPFYHVLGYFMKDELPGVFENAGAEIKETVDEFIKSIENEAVISNKN